MVSHTEKIHCMLVNTRNTDIVMLYSFGRCDYRLEASDFDPSYRDASFFGSTSENFLKHAPWINDLFQQIPDWIAQKIHPAMASFITQKRVCIDHFLAN
jgi:hypothetical protein